MMNTRRLGGELTVSEMGLGCMRMSAFYGDTDEQESIRTIHRCLDLGINFLDTAEMYGPHLNEELIGQAVGGRRDDFVVATKFGVYYGDGPGDSAGRSVDGSPENVRRAI